jgi:hypothetical protein
MYTTLRQLNIRAVHLASLNEPGTTITLSPAQLAMLIEGIDWRAPERTWRPAVAG